MNLEQLKRLCDAATPGPWEFGRYSGRECGLLLLSKDANSGHLIAGRENVRFIVAARTALPELIARCEALVTRNNLLEAVATQTKALREAQKDYMANRGNEEKGKVVAECAIQVDGALAALENL